MATRPYQINFKAPPGQVVSDCKRVEQALLGVEKAAARAETAVSKLGTAVGGLNALNAALGKVASTGTAAGTALRNVGQGNRGVGQMTNRLTALNAALGNAATQAGTAGAALATVGGTPGQGGGSGGKSSAGGGGGAGAVAKKAMGVGLVAAGLASRAMVGAGKDLRETMTESVKRTTEVRSGLKEYASLRGSNAGPTDAIVKEVTDFSLATGAGVDESTEFLTAYEGSAPTGRGKGNIGGKRAVGPDGKEIRKPAQEALERRMTVIAGQFGAATGLDAKTAGDLAGVVGQYTKINTPEDFARELGGMHYGLDQGRGAISTLARSELGAAGSSITEDLKTGKLRSLTELGAWVGVTSSISKSGSSSGTSYKQVSRLLNTTKGKGGHGFLEQSGVAGVLGDTAKLNKLADYFQAHPELNPGTFLAEQGFGNSTDVAATVSMVGNRDVLNQRIAAGEKVTGADVLARNAANQQSTLMMSQKSAVAEDVSVIGQGMLNERLEAGRAATRGAMNDPAMNDPNRVNRGRLKAQDWMTAITDYSDWWMSGEGATGEQQRVDVEMSRRMVQGLRNAGVDADKEFPGLVGNSKTTGWMMKSPQLGAEYGRAYERAQQVGADPMGGAPRNAASALRNAADALDDLDRGGDRGGEGFVPARR